MKKSLAIAAFGAVMTASSAHANYTLQCDGVMRAVTRDLKNKGMIISTTDYYSRDTIEFTDGGRALIRHVYEKSPDELERSFANPNLFPERDTYSVDSVSSTYSLMRVDKGPPIENDNIQIDRQTGKLRSYKYIAFPATGESHTYTRDETCRPISHTKPRM